jgi:hypothetical protein
MAAEQQEEYHEFDDSYEEEAEEEEEEGAGAIDVSDIKSTPSKALRPSTYKDRIFIVHAGNIFIPFNIL